MPSRSGYADLPLHGGRVPAWLERSARGPTFDAYVENERALAPEYGGRTVFDR